MPSIPLTCALIFEVGTLERSYSSQTAEEYAALVLSRVESQVSRGENAEHRLTHVSIVRTLRKIGEFKPEQAYSQDIQLTLEPGNHSYNLRLIVFLQEARQGRVLRSLGSTQCTHRYQSGRVRGDGPRWPVKGNHKSLGQHAFPAHRASSSRAHENKMQRQPSGRFSICPLVADFSWHRGTHSQGWPSIFYTYCVPPCEKHPPHLDIADQISTGHLNPSFKLPFQKTSTGA